jgi:hypothetical protein
MVANRVCGRCWTYRYGDAPNGARAASVLRVNREEICN